MRRDIKPSWYLTTKLNTQYNLFSEDTSIENYLVRGYVCKCGHDEIVIGDDIHKNYKCSSCGNEFFFSIENIQSDLKSFVENIYYNRNIKLAMNISYEVGVYNNKVQALAKVKIPHKIDFQNKKIVKKELPLLKMDYKSKPEKIKRSPFSSAYSKLHKLAGDEKLFESFVDRKLSSNKIKREKQFNFVLNYYNLKDFEFMKWSHKHHLKKESYTIEQALEELSNSKKYKSVKKAIYKNYQFQLNRSKHYYPNFINMVTKKFDDPNHIVTLLNLEIQYKIFDNDDLLHRFMNFMLSQYSKKQIVNYFKKFDKNNELYMLRDTVLSFDSISHTIGENFNKVRCTKDDIHDEFIRISLINKYKQKEITILGASPFTLNA